MNRKCRASSTDPRTSTTYDEALAAAGFDGVGYALTPDDGFVLVDLDGVIGDMASIS